MSSQNEIALKLWFLELSGNGTVGVVVVIIALVIIVLLVKPPRGWL